MNAELGILQATNDKELQEILIEGYRNTEFYCKTFYPDIFSAEFDAPHKQIFDVLDNCDAPFIAIKAPRGIGKSSIAKAYASKAIHYKIANFLVYISQTSDFAVTQTENIKTMMRTSEIGVRIFGKPEDRLSASIPEQFAKLAWVYNNGVFILPRGAGQQVRGLNYQPGRKNYRPELLILDDLVKKKDMENETLRDELWRWFKGDVMKTRSYVGDFFRIVYIDTQKHADDILQRIIDSPIWTVVDIPLADSNLESNFPTFISTEEVREEYKVHEEEGALDVFFLEYMGQAISDVDKAFKKEFFRYYDPDSKEFKEIKERLITATILDPAKTVKIQSAKSGLVVWSIDPETGIWYQRLAEGVKMGPDELFDYAVETAKFFKSSVLAYETTGLEEFITYPLEKAAREKHFTGSLVKLKARRGSGEFRDKGRGKEGRVAGLIPFYRKGTVMHNRRNSKALEAQLLSFPNSRYWDIMDAAAYFPQLLKMASFFPMDYAERNYDYELEEKKYKELLAREEPALDGFLIC